MHSKTKLELNDWEWEILDCRYFSILSDFDQIPKSLLHINHCNCKTGCTNNHCSFVKYGLSCTELVVFVSVQRIMYQL